MVGVRFQALALACVAFSGCAHEVKFLGEEPAPIQAPAQRAPLTVAVSIGPFDDTRLNAQPVVDHFARALRDAELFQNVMYPIPPGVEPTWEMEVSATDSASEPDANLWKSALASALLPAALFVYMESDYTLRLEVLALKDRVMVASYSAEAPVRHRWQAYANTLETQAEGANLVVDAATREILAAISRDLAHLEEADRQ